MLDSEFTMNQKRIIISPDTRRKNRIPPGLHETRTFPVLHYGNVPVIDLDKWSFRIFGLVDKEVTLTYKELLALPQVELHCDIHCVTGWSRLDNIFEGIQTLELKKIVKIDPDACHVLVHGYNNFSTNLPIAEFFWEDNLLAHRNDGKEITPCHGWPIRLVVPRLYFWKSAKWVTGVEFIKEKRLGFWETYGYHEHGDPWTEERYSY